MELVLIAFMAVGFVGGGIAILDWMLRGLVGYAKRL